jgi:hypothetical protein
LRPNFAAEAVRLQRGQVCSPWRSAMALSGSLGGTIGCIVAALRLAGVFH